MVKKNTYMNSDSKKELILKILALCIGTLVSISGLIFILSWHLGWMDILMLPPSIEVVSYASSVNILLSGLAIIALFFPSLFFFSNLCGGFIALIALLRAIELAFNIHFGLTQMMARFIASPKVTAPESLMPGIIAIGFLLIGTILFIWTKNKRHPLQSILILLASLIVFLLGLCSTLSYLVPIRYSFIWWGTPLNFYSQINAMMIGAGLMSAAFWYDLRFKLNFDRSLPILLTALITSFAIFTSWGLALEKGDLLKH